VAVNLKGAFMATKFALPHLRKSPAGRIINIASVHAFHGGSGPAYAPTKAAVVNLTRDTAVEVAPDNITVNAICPGAVRTVTNEPRMTYDAHRLGQSVAEYEATMTPLGRRLESEEIAPMAVYLASDAASVVTGQAWNIDGGVFMW
jgi:NAD(P)-dependent dehydrogenase (short-subunit alcohol dehydrogenase family)